MTLRSALLEVDLSALRHNLDLVCDLAGDREVIASIKANAYGFGVVEISRALVAAGVRKLWTGNFDEAIELREAGIESEILLFGGADPQHFATLLRHDLQPTVFEERSLTALAAAAREVGRQAPVWVKVDAGLGRLGVPIDQAFAFISRVAADPALDLRGVYTHLPFGTIDGRAWALGQYGRYQALLTQLADARITVPTTQVWGSSGLLAELPDACNAVCVGHALYGLTPLAEDVATRPPFRSLIHALSAPVIRADGDTSGGGAGGYGAVATGRPGAVAIGLGDGLKKAIEGAVPQVIVSGRRVRINAFTLEHLMIDLGDTAGVTPFDRALVIGDDGEATVTLYDWAAWTGSTPLEWMMALSGRTPVRYVGASNP